MRIRSFVFAVLTALMPLTLQATVAVGDITSRSYISSASGRSTLSLIDLDINRDGVITSDEVGTALFKLYDRDGNGIIDKGEYERGIVVSVTTGRVDASNLAYSLNGNIAPPGTPEAYDKLKSYTGLNRFETSSSGISPHDFLGKDMARQMNLTTWLNLYTANRETGSTR